MKKLFQLRSLLRQFAERLITIVFGLICLALVVHYWPSDNNTQTKREVVGKVLIVLNGEKIVFTKTWLTSLRSLG